MHLIAAMVLFFAVGAAAQPTNFLLETEINGQRLTSVSQLLVKKLTDAEVQGRNLAQQLATATPAENSTNTGTLKIRDARGNQKVFFIRVQTIVASTNWQDRGENWQNIFETVVTNADGSTDGECLRIVHLKFVQPGSAPDEYEWNNYGCFFPRVGRPRSSLGGSEWSGSSPTGFARQFSQSDFCALDLGLEFFHWPQQKFLKKEVHRSCGCTVLESTNPNPSTNGYSRVVSWIDSESLGIVEAYAYDVHGKKLKNFYPKNLEKVNGQYQVQTMIMENLQTGSRTRLEFDLKK